RQPKLPQAAVHLESREKKLEQQLEPRRADLERPGDEPHREPADVARSRDEVARLSAEVARLAAEVRSLHESTSWRVTAPMRGLKNAALGLWSALRRIIFRRAPSPVDALEDDRALISRTGLFDPEYYGARAVDLDESGLDPVVHYLTRGAAAGLDPHPLFDTSFYREAGAEVGDGVNPLVHYLRDACSLRHNPHPFFYTSFY